MNISKETADHFNLVSQLQSQVAKLQKEGKMSISKETVERINETPIT